jgi:hypothetical protein
MEYSANILVPIIVMGSYDIGPQLVDRHPHDSNGVRANPETVFEIHHHCG